VTAKCIHAWTEAPAQSGDQRYPAYLNVSRDNAGKVWLTVRNSAVWSDSKIVTIEMTPDQMWALGSDLLREMPAKVVDEDA
jgi:hypothetical protein